MIDRNAVCSEIAAVFQKHGCTLEEALQILKFRAPEYLFRHISLDHMPLTKAGEGSNHTLPH